MVSRRNELHADSRACCSVSLLGMNTILRKSGTCSCLSKEKSKLWIETITPRAFRLAAGTDFQLMWTTGVPTAQGSSGAGLIYTSGRFSSAYAPFSVKCTCFKLTPAQPESGNKTDVVKYRELPKAPSLQKCLGKWCLSIWGVSMGHYSYSLPKIHLCLHHWHHRVGLDVALQQRQCWGRENLWSGGK